ncbi:MAG: hypothetical protein IT562_09890 [Alphaproteobacteria bacterium]|nr:hypothetical protein [Alphaproteobacteria bacterium]
MLPLATSAAYVERYSRGVIDATRYSFAHLLYYHLASMIALREQGIVAPARARRIIGALLDLLDQGADRIAFDPALENLQPNVERAIAEAIGPEDAGDLSLGRARAEFGYVAEMLAVREDMLRAVASAASLGDCLTSQAAALKDVLAPFYTVHMRAEPITLGYYFAAFAENLEQQTARLRSSYGRMNLSSAAVGHIVPSPVGMNRRRISALLGYDNVVRNSLYGYVNGDVAIDALGAAANTAASISRLALDLYLWAGSDLKLIAFGDAWCSGSFIMPQKRNPSFLKPVRRSAIKVATLHGEALELMMHTAPIQLVDTMGIPALAHQGLGELAYALDLMSAALATITVDRSRGAELAGCDFMQAAQLVDLVMRQAGVSWRQAEQIVGHFVRDAGMNPDARALESIAGALLGRSITIADDAFRSAMDPAAIVASRGDSGPAPDAVAAMSTELAKIFRDARAFVDAERSRLAATWRRLVETARTV